MNQNEINQTDSLIIDRSREVRAVVAIASLVALFIAGIMVGGGFAVFFKLPAILGTGAGLALGGLLVMWILPKIYIVNSAVSAFVTIDLFATLFGGNKSLVTYGPGFHFCFPWEKREGDNTVDLTEAAEGFPFKVQAIGGNLDGKYSVRLRPDITRLPEFLAGVAAVAADLGDLITAEIVADLSNQEVNTALKNVAALNKKLADKFKHGERQGEEASAFEERFGVIIGDVTVSELMPSKEVSETMSAQTESAVIDDIVAKSFGKDTIRDLQASVDAGVISQDEVNRRRNQTMAMSGNLQGMDFSESTFNLRISGLDKVDPALAEAITAAAPLIARFGGQQKPAAKKPK